MRTETSADEVAVVIDGFAKNKQHLIVGQISLVKGSPYAFFKTMAPSAEEEGAWIPIGGVGVPVEQFQEVRDAIHRLFDVAGERLVAQIDLKKDELRIGIEKFKGQQLAYVRRFYKKDESWLPGKAGINVNVTRLSELCDLADRIAEAISKVSK